MNEKIAEIVAPNEKLAGFDQRACILLDEGIELFAPMDLVIFK